THSRPTLSFIRWVASIPMLRLKTITPRRNVHETDKETSRGESVCKNANPSWHDRFRLHGCRRGALAPVPRSGSRQFEGRIDADCDWSVHYTDRITRGGAAVPESGAGFISELCCR